MAKAKKKVVNGITFDSKTEADYYVQLLHREQAGEIFDLWCQPQFELFEPFQLRKRKVQGMVYTPDFSYTDADGNYHVVEVKGFARERYTLTRKIFLYFYGDSCIFHEVKRRGKNFTERVW